MARYARRMINVGARFVGGCCGTTPDHIKKIRDYVASVQPRLATVVANRTASEPARTASVPLAERSNWGRKIAGGGLVTSIEVAPPKGCVPDDIIESCRMVRAAGVDAVSLLDGPRAHSLMGVVPLAIILEREVGIETVIHYTCRDRNMLGMISDLLGAAAAGLRNILIVTGDPPEMGPYPDSTAVFDIDSIGLTNVVDRLNHGLDPGGDPIGDPTRYVIGVAVNQSAVDVDRELSRFAWKVDAGADFAVTQPVFDPAELETLLRRIKGTRVPIVMSVWPLVSFRNAEFLANEVPGLRVPDGVVERMRRAQERGDDAARAEGVTIAREIVHAATGAVQGIQVVAPYGRIDVALEVLAE
jgi:homocysteine S-methyltransferase